VGMGVGDVRGELDFTSEFVQCHFSTLGNQSFFPFWFQVEGTQGI
jgi:hypothetical protein